MRKDGEIMEPFTHYKINETEQGIEVVLYLDENLTEFSDELGTVSKMEESTIEKEAVGFIKRMFPTLKVKSVKIMAGAMLLTSLGFGAISTTEASAAESTVTQSQMTSSSYIVSPGDTLSEIAARNGTTVDAIKQANHLSSDVIRVGQTLVIPSTVSTAPAQANANTYQVVSGDTLSGIAARNNTTVDAIKQANQLNSDIIQVGQTLVIPSGVSSTLTGTTYQVVSGDTLSGIAARNGTTVDAIKQTNHLNSDFIKVGQTLTIPSGVSSAPAQTNGGMYQVASGDTLSGIAARNGTTVDAIKQANHLNSDFIKVGQTLSIPSGVSSAPTQTNGDTYQVVSGDTLSGIAARNGTTTDAIKQANHLNSDFIQVGQTLTIPSSVSPAPTTQTETQPEANNEEVEWLAKMIYSESRGESLEGQIAIGAVIMNRVESPLFPNNVKDVLFEKSYGYYQFTPAETGSIHTATPNAQNIEAAKRAINGEDPTNGALFFYNPDKTSSPYLKSRTVSTIIGNHTFTF